MADPAASTHFAGGSGKFGSGMPARELRLISWPFHNGLRGVGMGSGAARLMADDLLRAGIARAGWKVSREAIDSVDESGPEVARIMALIKKLAASVRVAADEGAFPLVLAGNCNSCLGTCAGIGEQLGVVWFDAHADFDDPEENTSGFFDVMGLAMLSGRGWRALRERLPGHVPIPERNLVLAAVRDLEPHQSQRLERSEVLVVPGEIDPASFDAALGDLLSRVTRVYLHVDLDSVDINDAHANQYAAAGGPSLDRLSQCVRLACERSTVAAAAIAAYDPAFDPDGRALAAARRIATDIAETVRR